MRKIVIVDIDGTISKVGERLKYLKQDPKDWDSFYNDCFDDEPILPIIELVMNLDKAGYLIVFLTGRREKCRHKTMMWLRRYMGKFSNNQIFMRSNNDEREDMEVKPDILNRILIYSHIPKDQIAFLLEDRTSMVKKWRELGYTCLQVADGDF